MNLNQVKVLIVEDELVIAMDLERTLTEHGCDVVGIAHSGEMAISALEEKKPDAMLVDIGLNGSMNGIELVHKIKENGDLPIIFLSSSTDDEQMAKAEETYPSAYIQKPFDERQLISTLKISYSRFTQQKERLEKLQKDNKFKEMNIKELSETNDHLIAATWRERELKNELQKTKEIIEVQTKKILDSINYAKRIQTCIAPLAEQRDEALQNHFLFYKPKDVVSGDFPWLYDRDDYYYFAAVDCTGHGVPGAMMSMIGNLLLNDVVNNESKMKTPAETLAMLHVGVVKTLKQDDPDNNAADGMDIALCRLKKDRSELMFAGAHLPLYHLRGKELTEYKGSRFPVGGTQYRNRNKYADHVVDIQKGDKIFIFSDGYIDQIGGPENRKIMSTGLKELLVENAELDVKEIGVIAEKYWQDWLNNGAHNQIDDVILFGVEI